MYLIKKSDVISSLISLGFGLFETLEAGFPEGSVITFNDSLEILINFYQNKKNK